MKTFFWVLAATTVMLLMSTPVFADVFENFNSFTPSGYGTYTYNGFRIVNGLGSNQNNCDTTRGVRLRDALLPDSSNQPYLEYIGADGNGKDGGVGVFSFWYRNWDGNPACVYRVSVSVNGGPYDSLATINTTSVACLQFSHALNNASDNIKIRVQRISGERLLIDDFFIADYVGGDTTRPTIASVSVISASQLDVLFSEPVQQASAETPGNYVVTPGSVSPTTAVQDANPALVHLTFASPFAPNNYTLAVSNVRDIAGNAILPGSTAPFVIAGIPNIIFTEIMPNPNFSGTADSLGEWFEIFNAENYAVNMTNWVIADNAGRDTLEGPVTINPGQYFVFCSNGNQATNGGVPVDYAYRFATSGWGLSLSNTADQLTLRNGAGQLVATQSYTSAFPFAAAHSMQLRDLSYNPAVDTSWCRAEVTWPSANNGDFGTPQQATNCNVPAPDTLTVCELRQQDSCGVPQYLNQRVVTRGVVTFADTCRRIAYLQSNDCAVAIFGAAVFDTMLNSNRAMAAGDSIMIDGTLTQFNGLTEIATSGSFIPTVTFISSGHSASATDLACNLIATTVTTCDAEAYESRLVRVGPVTFVNAGGNFSIGEANYAAICGTDTVILRVDSCDALLGAPIPAGQVYIHGVLGQFDNTSCYCSGYQINYAGGNAFTPAQCVDPQALTVYRDGTNNTVTLRWSTGLNQPCNCFEIYYANSADAVFPAGYTYLARVIGVQEYTDLSVFAPRRFYVVTAGGPNCP